MTVARAAHIETEREVGVLDEARSSPRMKRFARSFPFIVTRPPTQPSLIGQSSKLSNGRPLKFCSNRKITFNGDAKSSGEKRMDLKAFCRFWCCWKGFIKGIKGGTSCCIGEAKGGVQA